jgi:hypothetical protein
MRFGPQSIKKYRVRGSWRRLWRKGQKMGIGFLRYWGDSVYLPLFVEGEVMGA